MSTLTTTHHAPFAQSVLAAHQYQGQSNDCAVISVAMVLNVALNLDMDGTQLGEKWGQLQWRGLRPVLRRVPRWAAFPWSMVAELREHGLQANWHILKTPDFIADRLQAGDYLMPIIGSWRPLWAHVMVLVALDPARGYGFANPAIQTKTIDWMPATRFETVWNTMGRTLVSARLKSQ